MEIMELAAKLGQAIKADERIAKMEEARIAYEKDEEIQKLMLEIKSLRQAQEIYLDYAGIVAETMTGLYQGKTRVSHKGNRTTLHFYLSDTEKAVITFFQEKMPWSMPEPPTDPESLRKACQEEGSPFFIVSLSKRDRRNLNTR